MKQPLYQLMAVHLQTVRNSIAHGNNEWAEHWDSKLREYEKMLPSGSGFDAGTKLLRRESTPRQLVLETAFHHMDEHGFYDGWTEHKVIVKANLTDRFDLQVTGKNKNDIKHYILQVFYEALQQGVEL